jgi:cellulose synthase/poly-beta-1,6-N-acetylglucosamine synthase-like glycosyltransferase
VIGRCIKSILGQDYPRDRIEVIVVSADDSTAEICRGFDGVKVIKEENPRGKPAALNLGLKFASGDIIAVFDADSVLDKDCLMKAAAYFQKGALAVQGKTGCLNKNQNMLTTLVYLEQEAWQCLLLSGRDRFGLFVPFTGSCLFIKKELLEELGGWDENSLAEDVELSARLLLRNIKVTYANDAVSWQEAPGKLRTLVKQRVRWYRGYVETSVKYLSLLKRPSSAAVDAEIFLLGPVFMALSLLGYGCWIASIIYPVSDMLLEILASFLGAVTAFSVTFSLVAFERSPDLGNIALIPLIYVYWMIQSSIAMKSILDFILGRPKAWGRTEKEGWVPGYVVNTCIALGTHQPRAPLEFIGALISLLPRQGEPTSSHHELKELLRWRKTLHLKAAFSCLQRSFRGIYLPTSGALII